MTSAFFGLDIASRALRTQQTLVDIANQNIANANTPGFSRQAGVVTQTAAYPLPVFRMGGGSGQAGQLGTGVQVKEVTRARDQFADYQIRGQLSAQGRWDARKDALTQVESIINEPSTTGISSTMGKYFAAWQEVANSPADTAVRANLLQSGEALTDAIRNTSAQLHQQQRDLDSQVELTMSSINDYSTQVANLNVQISQVESTGLKANDLRDQRDLALDKLSSLVKVSFNESVDGSVNVFVGSHQLVDREHVHSVGVDGSSGFNTPVWTDATPSTPMTLTDGKLLGIVQSRDTLVQDRIDGLDQLANRLMESVNAVHMAGVGSDGKSGRPFFSGTDASDISLTSALQAIGGTSLIAAGRMQAATPPATGYSFFSGDSSNAIAIAQIQTGVTQRDVGQTSGLHPSQTLGAATVVGVDLSHASVNSNYTVHVTAGSPTPTVTFSQNGGAPVTATLTVGADPSGNQVITADGGTLGVRISVSAASGTTLNAALAGLDGQVAYTPAGQSSPNDQYANLIATLGVDSSTAASQSTNQQVLVDQLNKQRAQTSGVSLDEETTHLIQYQHAYQAAARVISVVDSMLDTLINNTGVR
jgi:flagellar hook-associated protein 1 FlgK